jgi:hypothetical protein
VGLALEEQMKSSSASAPSSPRPHRSIKLLQNQINRRSHGEIGHSRPEEPRDAFRLNTPEKGDKEWEPQEAEVVADKLGEKQQEEEVVRVVKGIEMQEQQQQEEVEELDELALAEQDEVEEEHDIDNPENEEQEEEEPGELAMEGQQ